MAFGYHGLRRRVPAQKAGALRRSPWLKQAGAARRGQGSRSDPRSGLGLDAEHGSGTRASHMYLNPDTQTPGLRCLCGAGGVTLNRRPCRRYGRSPRCNPVFSPAAWRRRRAALRQARRYWRTGPQLSSSSISIASAGARHSRRGCADNRRRRPCRLCNGTRCGDGSNWPLLPCFAFRITCAGARHWTVSICAGGRFGRATPHRGGRIGKIFGGARRRARQRHMRHGLHR